MIPAALSYPVTASGVAVAGRALFRGITYAETAGSAGTVTVYDAQATGDTAKPLIPKITLAANGSGSAPSFDIVAAVERGISVVITGAVTVVVFTNPETKLLADLGLFDDGTTDLTELGLARLIAQMGS